MTSSRLGRESTVAGSSGSIGAHTDVKIALVVRTPAIRNGNLSRLSPGIYVASVGSSMLGARDCIADAILVGAALVFTFIRIGGVPEKTIHVLITLRRRGVGDLAVSRPTPTISNRKIRSFLTPFCCTSQGREGCERDRDIFHTTGASLELREKHVLTITTFGLASARHMCFDTRRGRRLQPALHLYQSLLCSRCWKGLSVDRSSYSLALRTVTLHLLTTDLSKSMKFDFRRCLKNLLFLFPHHL
jgi:hypothetical protein